jgi:hypothetical protein
MVVLVKALFELLMQQIITAKLLQLLRMVMLIVEE